jgi:hypothetical protein
MPRITRRRSRKAKFPRLKQIREERLGWSVAELFVRLPGGRPSPTTIYRLERGGATRISAARRVFDVVNAALGGKLDVRKEIKVR